MRRHRSIATLVTLVALLAPLASSAADEPPLVGSLSLDGPGLFWSGDSVGADPAHSLPLVPSNAAIDRCSQVGPCFKYRLDVAPGGKLLRIGFDTPERDDGFEIVVTAPGGAVTRRATNNVYSAELRIAAPDGGTVTPGEYLVTVAPYGADNAAFRMRARLETAEYEPVANEAGEFLPNLRVFRLWEFGFVAPANPGNGVFPPDDLNPPLDVAGIHPVSCAVDETAEDSATKCLRYSFGLANIGEGPFDIRYSGDRLATSYDMTQCIKRDGQPPLAHAAGTGSFHKTHGHFHYDDIIYHELFAVDPETNELTSAGKGKKLGYSPADQGMPEWFEFTQAAPGTSSEAGNCAPGTSSRLGMSRGWGDAYRYQRPGNYVDFNSNGDGEYVVQTIADPMNHVRETDEDDNTTYAHIRVAGDVVTILEVGLGEHPWDPAKEVIA